jgi:hypothetical protein
MMPHHHLLLDTTILHCPPRPAHTPKPPPSLVLSDREHSRPPPVHHLRHSKRETDDFCLAIRVTEGICAHQHPSVTLGKVASHDELTTTPAIPPNRDEREPLVNGNLQQPTERRRTTREAGVQRTSAIFLLLYLINCRYRDTARMATALLAMSIAFDMTRRAYPSSLCSSAQCDEEGVR